jgi:protein TonB
MAIKVSNATLKTTIYFVVEPDGSVNRIKAVGDNAEFNAEAERTLSSIKTKYQPATVNNLSVRYLLRFPLTMNFK